MSTGTSAPTPIAFARDLEHHADRVAVVAGDQELTYAQLARRAGEVADRLGPTRRLVLLRTRNTVDAVVAYLGARRGGHPVLLTSDTNDEHAAGLIDRYHPDVVIDGRIDGSTGGPVDGPSVAERRAGTIHDLHPDLALLLSTSGSTGSPKLVRLSHENLHANAAAIAAYLELRADDRAITSLPMHYCYGLSVLHSHLAVGASLVLTDLSVADRCFWRAVTEHGVTSFAGVPHTFAMLDRIGFEHMDLPALRTVTQAGGRLAPDDVRRYARLGRQRGWRLFVMYGQTEATARMAYLPPDLATQHPGAIGRPIPGGSFEIEPVDGCAPGEGELVYRGPNVMLGYAECPTDLARGRDIEALRTGDLARRAANGLYEVTGRRSRFIKPFGLRVDLDVVERRLADEGVVALCAGDDQGLAVALDATATNASATLVAERVRDLTDLPPAAIAVTVETALPRLANGKPDHPTVLRRARERKVDPSSQSIGEASIEERVRALYRELLAVDDVARDSTFVALGGDSLSYVEVSLGLEQILGTLPPDWPTTTVAGLAASARPTQRRSTSLVETSVVLRAVAITLIVSSHARLGEVKGGAHLLLAVAGFNLARFQLASSDGRPLRLGRSILSIALPTIAWITMLAVGTDGDHGWTNLALVHNHTGPAHHDERWHYWFVEVLVQLLAVAAVAFAIPAVRRVEHRHRFGFPFAIAAIGALLVRADVMGLAGIADRLYRPQTLFWLFALGWAAAQARTSAQRWAVTLLAVVALPGFFGTTSREAIVAGGVVLLTWVPAVAVPRRLAVPVSAVAAASLAIYLTHWQVYPWVGERTSPGVAVLASLLFGVAAVRLGRRLPSWRGRGRRSASDPARSERFDAVRA